MKLASHIVVCGCALWAVHCVAAQPKRAPACDEYISTGQWIYRYQEWSLELVPTACGREISAADTPYMFYEIAKKYAGSPYWTNTRGMINQLTCHLAIARKKVQWDLDPWRPYVGYAATVVAGCNPTVPDPEKPFH